MEEIKPAGLIQNVRSSNLSETQAISYALPAIASGMLMTPMGIIQGIYAKHYGIALTTLAIIITVSRIFDAITDPIIGYLSDRYYRKTGSRKPFIVAGMFMLLVSGYFLYSPGEEVTVAYASAVFLSFYLAYTLFEIPHVTWPCDISRLPSVRSKFYSYRVMAIYIGMIIFYAVPLLPLFPSREITPETLKVAFWLAAVLAIIFLYFASRLVPSGRRHKPVVTVVPTSQRANDGAYYV